MYVCIDILVIMHCLYAIYYTTYIYIYYVYYIYIYGHTGVQVPGVLDKCKLHTDATHAAHCTLHTARMHAHATRAASAQGQALYDKAPHVNSLTNGDPSTERPKPMKTNENQ